MMGALRLLFALEPACADAYFGGIAHELDALIETSAERIASPASWDVLVNCSASARHPARAEKGFGIIENHARRRTRERV